MTARDAWGSAASTRLTVYVMRATLAGRNFAPDQTYELSKAGQVAPVSAQIAQILQQHADLWAEDGRAAERAGIDFDADAEWRAHMDEATAAVGRFLADRKARAA
jgi:hypothetical protein